MKKLLLTLLAILVITPVQSAPLFYGEITYQKLEPYFKKCAIGAIINNQEPELKEAYRAEYKIDRSNYYIEAIVPTNLKNRLFKTLDDSAFVRHVYMREVPVNMQNKYAMYYTLNLYSTPATLTIRKGNKNEVINGWWCKIIDTNGTGIYEWFYDNNFILSWKVLY